MCLGCEFGGKPLHEVKKNLGLGLSLSVPTPLTHTSRTEKSEFSFKGPLSLKPGCPESVMIKQGLSQTGKWITLAPCPPSSQCCRTLLLFMTTQHVS